MTAILRLLLLAFVLAYCLAFGATSSLAAHAKAHRARTLRINVHPGNWLHFTRPMPLGVRAVAYAKHFLGVPYQWGGSSPGGFDCSGLVRYVYPRVRVELPHSSHAGFNPRPPLRRRGLEPRDLRLFR